MFHRSASSVQEKTRSKHAEGHYDECVFAAAHQLSAWLTTLLSILHSSRANERGSRRFGTQVWRGILCSNERNGLS